MIELINYITNNNVFRIRFTLVRLILKNRNGGYNMLYRITLLFDRVFDESLDILNLGNEL